MGDGGDEDQDQDQDGDEGGDGDDGGEDRACLLTRYPSWGGFPFSH